jgi:ubiquinone/menaquinone biosynthesis C-methylase UbiE
MKARIECFILELRDRLGIPFKPEKELAKLDIQKGQIILDFGCGTGSFALPVARMVGEKGRVYALDKQPFAIKKVKEKGQKEGLDNIETVLSDGDTGPPDRSIDAVLFYGVLPEIEDKEAVLKELHRVLNPNGYLSTRYYFRMKKQRLLRIVESTELYSLREQKGHILNFVPR